MVCSPLKKGLWINNIVETTNRANKQAAILPCFLYELFNTANTMKIGAMTSMKEATNSTKKSNPLGKEEKGWYFAKNLVLDCKENMCLIPDTKNKRVTHNVRNKR